MGEVLEGKNALPAYTRSLKVFVGIYYTTHPLGQPIREVELPEIKIFKLLHQIFHPLLRCGRHVLDFIRGIRATL